MTKLMEWLSFITVFFSIWIALITGTINSTVTKEWHQVILFSPIIVLFLCGIYAAVTILYRVFTFNNCEAAALELQEQIEEAKKDLQSKGILLKNK